ncbi:MAG: hypothetical protein K1W21_18315, partial [Oscillospiraceae bacterium]
YFDMPCDTVQKVSEVCVNFSRNIQPTARPPAIMVSQFVYYEDGHESPHRCARVAGEKSFT